MTLAQSAECVDGIQNVKRVANVFIMKQLNTDWLIDDPGTSVHPGTELNTDRLAYDPGTSFHPGTELNTDRLVDDPGTSTKRVDGIQNSGELRGSHGLLHFLCLCLGLHRYAHQPHCTMTTPPSLWLHRSNWVSSQSCIHRISTHDWNEHETNQPFLYGI